MASDDPALLPGAAVHEPLSLRGALLGLLLVSVLVAAGSGGVVVLAGGRLVPTMPPAGFAPALMASPGTGSSGELAVTESAGSDSASSDGKSPIAGAVPVSALFAGACGRLKPATPAGGPPQRPRIGLLQVSVFSQGCKIT